MSRSHLISPSSPSIRGLRRRSFLNLYAPIGLETSALIPLVTSDTAWPTLSRGLTKEPTMPLPMPLKNPPTPSRCAPSMGFVTMFVKDHMPSPMFFPADRKPSRMLAVFRPRPLCLLLMYSESKVKVESKLPKPALTLSTAFAAKPIVFFPNSNGIRGKFKSELCPRDEKTEFNKWYV